MTDTAHDPHHARRWLILAVLGVAQLMVILDATVVNVALPSAQQALDFDDENRQWVVTAYALTFGSLLPLGGRLSDLLGRKWIFIAGLLGFALASAIGGAAQSIGMLIAARALQGVFAALLAPAALSLLTSTFTEPSERNKAFAIFGGIGGAGGTVGLLLGGVLTDALTWRWAMYVNIAFAIPAAAAAWTLLTNHAADHRPRLDLPGTLAASTGLFFVVFGFAKAETEGWGAAITLISLALSIVLLTVFVLIQRRTSHPLLPLHIVTDRTRGGSFLTLALGSLGLYAVFLFLTFFLQQNLGFTPVRTGLAFLPLTFALPISAGIAQTRLLPRVGPRPLIVAGLLIGAVGMVLLAQIDADATYASGVLPGLIVLGIGLGLTLATALNTSTLGVAAEDSGAAGAMTNTSQQIGSAIGVALLSTLSANAATSFLEGKQPNPALLAGAAIEGYTTAFWTAAAVFLLAAALCGALVRGGVPDVDPDAAPAMSH